MLCVSIPHSPTLLCVFYFPTTSTCPVCVPHTLTLLCVHSQHCQFAVCVEFVGSCRMSLQCLGVLPHTSGLVCVFPILTRMCVYILNTITWLCVCVPHTLSWLCVCVAHTLTLPRVFISHTVTLLCVLYVCIPHTLSLLYGLIPHTVSQAHVGSIRNHPSVHVHSPQSCTAVCALHTFPQCCVHVCAFPTLSTASVFLLPTLLPGCVTWVCVH